MKIIINADDFGLTKSINEAIFKLASLKTISSTTVMVNMPFADEIKSLADNERFGIGLHFNLTEGKPISEPADVVSLIDNNGEFHSYKSFKKKLDKGIIDPKHIQTELEAQYNKLFSLIGNKISHFDSHQSIHRLSGVYKIIVPFVAKNNKGLRPSTRFFIQKNKSQNHIINPIIGGIFRFSAKRFLTEFFYFIRTKSTTGKVFFPKAELLSDDFKKIETLIRLPALSGSNFKNDVFEVSCHPSITITELDSGKTTLLEKRIDEYKILSSEVFIDYVNANPLFNYSNSRK